MTEGEESFFTNSLGVTAEELALLKALREQGIKLQDLTQEQRRVWLLKIKGEQGLARLQRMRNAGGDSSGVKLSASKSTTAAETQRQRDKQDQQAAAGQQASEALESKTSGSPGLSGKAPR